jgi:hypothetical protein
MAPRGGPGAKTKTKDAPKKVVTPKPEPKPKPKTKPVPAPIVLPQAIEEPVMTEAQRDSMARAEERSFVEAERFATAGAVFRSTLKTFFPGAENDTWINELFEAAKPRVTAGFETNQILDLMLQNGETPRQFNERFRGIFELDKKRDAGQQVYVPSIAEYIAGEQEYTRLVTKFGMSNLGTIDNYANVVANDVSIDEVRDRIATATQRVNAIDSATMEQLRVEFPSLQQSDLVQAVLNKETPQDLQNRITRAEIGVEAKQAGIVSRLGTQALQEAGVDRTQARRGFQALAEYQRTAGAGITQAQQMFGETTRPEDLQTELEKEALLGQTSKTRKRLESQARAQFGGQSGIATGSLSRKRQV